MAVTLHIPDSITNGLRLPESEIEPRLREIVQRMIEGCGALGLRYGLRGVPNLGRAAEAGEMSIRARHHLAVHHNGTRLIGVAASVLSREAAPSGKRADQRHSPLLVFLKPDNPG